MRGAGDCFAMDYPPFTEALARFRRFLNEQGHLGSIGWLCPSDVLLISRSWIIRPRPPDEVAEEVARAYHLGAIRRLGVLLSVLCSEGETIWCYIYCPADETEAELRMMPDGLKLSVPMPIREGRRASNDQEWSQLRPQDMM